MFFLKLKQVKASNNFRGAYFMKIYKLIAGIALSLIHVNTVAQGFKVSGQVADKSDNSSIIGATVAMYDYEDSTKWKNTVTDLNGNFEFSDVLTGKYRLKVILLTYLTIEKEFTVGNADVNLGILKMEAEPIQLKNVDIEAKQMRVEQKEDTIQFNADAYKTNRDANAEDLVTKMPGVTSENGTIKVNGEQVQQVLVDGKPFFGDDPNAAIKNLPAEIIDKIQVFDKLSDQSQFTGFDDGSSIKTINITTKAGKNNGQFGKVYGGYGEDDRYIAGGNINLFNGDRRISLIGLSNNINQQNFTTEDLLGVTGSSGAGKRNGGRGGGFGGRSGGGGQRSGGQNYQGDNNSINNFLVGPQPGIATTNALGLNYSDNWSRRVKVTGSYFFNSADNISNTSLTRNYISPQDSGLFYSENNNSESRNFNHRFNFRYENTLDSMNTLIITPKLSLQTYNSNSSLLGSNFSSENILESLTNNTSSSDNMGYNFSNNILLQHKFNTRRRTISLNLGTQVNHKDGTGSLYSGNNYYLSNESEIIDQHSTQQTDGYTLSANLSYTEPVGDSGQFLFNYTPSYTKNTADKETDNFDSFLSEYSQLDTALSNKYDNTYITQKAGASYRLSKKKFNFMSGVNFQHAALYGDQIFPATFNMNRTFESFLPQAMFNYKFSTIENIRIIYRTSTTAPSISQLQNVVNNSNTLLLSTGNPDLAQDYEHTLIIRYGKTNKEKGKGFFIFFYGNYVRDYIGNSSFTASADTNIAEGITLKDGSQLTRPVNLDGYWNARAFVTYAIPLTKLKVNLNLNSGFTLSHTPALINGDLNMADNYTLSKGVVIASNISENVDFTLSTTGNYSIVKNSLESTLNDNYYYQTSAVKLNLVFLKNFVFNTTVNYTLYSGISQSYNQDYCLWNASVGYKFLKNQSLELKAGVFDILNQNNSISRNVTDTYIEDSQSNVLNRYIMFNLTYTLRNFKK